MSSSFGVEIRKPISHHKVDQEQLLRYKLEKLENQNELFWKQRSHANWLKHGDRNTRYFHAFASERRRINWLKKLRNEHGNWVEGEEQLKHLVFKYYSALFTSQGGSLVSSFLNQIQPRVTQQMNEMLLADFTSA